MLQNTCGKRFQEIFGISNIFRILFAVQDRVRTGRKLHPPGEQHPSWRLGRPWFLTVAGIGKSWPKEPASVIKNHICTLWWFYLNLASCLLKNPSKTNVWMKFLVRERNGFLTVAWDWVSWDFFPVWDFTSVIKRKFMFQFPNLVNFI